MRSILSQKHNVLQTVPDDRTRRLRQFCGMLHTSGVINRVATIFRSCAHHSVTRRADSGSTGRCGRSQAVPDPADYTALIVG